MADLNVECKACMADLEAEWRVSARGNHYLSVEPCETCLGKRDEEAYGTGYEDGKVEGRNAQA